MVCENKWKRAFIQSIYVFGVFSGALFCGSLSDRCVNTLGFKVFRQGHAHTDKVKVSLDPSFLPVSLLDWWEWGLCKYGDRDCV